MKKKWPLSNIIFVIVIGGTIVLTIIYFMKYMLA